MLKIPLSLISSLFPHPTLPSQHYNFNYLNLLNINLTISEYTGGFAEGDTLINIENIIGSQFNDTLTGDDQDNLFNGGQGRNILFGGTGNDTFILNLGENSRDIIRDFEDGFDRLQLPDGVSLDQIEIKSFNQGQDTILRNQDNKDILAILRNIDSELISEDDFLI